MLILSRVCAEFHDNAGTVLFKIGPADRMNFIDAPESIKQDPLYGMLLNDGSLEAPVDKAAQKKLENDPEKAESAKAEPAETAGQPAQKEANASGAKAAAKK